MLSNLALYLRHAQPLEGAEEYESREELAHQAKVFSLVNEKIAKKEATSDEVIGSVAALACQSVRRPMLYPNRNVTNWYIARCGANAAVPHAYERAKDDDQSSRRN